MGGTHLLMTFCSRGQAERVAAFDSSACRPARSLACRCSLNRHVVMQSPAMLLPRLPTRGRPISKHQAITAKLPPPGDLGTRPGPRLSSQCWKPNSVCPSTMFAPCRSLLEEPRESLESCTSVRFVETPELGWSSFFEFSAYLLVRQLEALGYRGYGTPSFTGFTGTARREGP